MTRMGSDEGTTALIHSYPSPTEETYGMPLGIFLRVAVESGRVVFGGSIIIFADARWNGNTVLKANTPFVWMLAAAESDSSTQSRIHPCAGRMCFGEPHRRTLWRAW